MTKTLEQCVEEYLSHRPHPPHGMLTRLACANRLNYASLRHAIAKRMEEEEDRRIATRHHIIPGLYIMAPKCD